MIESTRFNKGLLTAEKMDELEGSTSSSRTKTRYAGTAKQSFRRFTTFLFFNFSMVKAEPILKLVIIQARHPYRVEDKEFCLTILIFIYFPKI